MPKETWLKKGLKSKLVSVLIDTVDKQQLEIDALKLRNAELQKNFASLVKITEGLRRILNKQNKYDIGDLTTKELEKLTLKQLRDRRIPRGDEEQNE